MEISETIEVMKVLVERAHTEAQLFWVRNGVMMGLHSAGLAWVVDRASKSTTTPWQVLLAAGVMGLWMSYIWYRLVYIGRLYNHQWLHDAKQLAMGTPELTTMFKLSLHPTEGASSESVFAKTVLQDRHGPFRESATRWMYVVVEAFALAWLATLIWGLVVLIQK